VDALPVAEENDALRAVRCVIYTGPSPLINAVLRLVMPPGTSAPSQQDTAEVVLRSRIISTASAEHSPLAPLSSSDSADVSAAADAPTSPDRTRVALDDHGSVLLGAELPARRRVDVLYPLRVPAGTTSHPVRRRSQWHTRATLSLVHFERDRFRLAGARTSFRSSWCWSTRFAMADTTVTSPKAKFSMAVPCTYPLRFGPAAPRTPPLRGA